MDERELRMLREAEAARVRRWRLSLIATAAGVAALTGGLVVGLGSEGDRATMGGVAAGVGAVLTLGGAIKGWCNRPGRPAAVLEASLGGRRDRVQRQRTQQLLLFPALMLAFFGQAFNAIEAVLAGRAEFHHLIQLSVPILYGWLIPAIVMGWDGGSRQNRKYLDDELTQVFRARSMILAFVVLMAGATLAFGLGLWRVQYGVAALPFVIAFGGAAAGLRFAWLDREAERG